MNPCHPRASGLRLAPSPCAPLGVKYALQPTRQHRRRSRAAHRRQMRSSNRCGWCTCTPASGCERRPPPLGPAAVAPPCRPPNAAGADGGRPLDHEAHANLSLFWIEFDNSTAKFHFLESFTSLTCNFSFYESDYSPLNFVVGLDGICLFFPGRPRRSQKR